ncbi:virulence protein [Brumimicrobium sp.]|uniref:virulence protein n=1 Tax=Brumimicrobium sp. TaxID=2029867 RepID=UPI003A932809
MFAISFDMLISDLKTHYGEVYNNAYYEIATVLEKFGFYRGQGSVYLSTNNDMANLLRAVNALKNIDWFKSSVRDIRAFRIEDWSDFTSFIKED